MKKFLKHKIGALLGFNAEIEKYHQVLTGVSVACHANTRQSARQQRASEDSPFMCAALLDVHAAVDREMDLREKLELSITNNGELARQLGDTQTARLNLRDALVRKTDEVLKLEEELKKLSKPGVFVEVESADQSPIMKELIHARERIKDMLIGDDGQAWKEAEKYMAAASVTDVVKVSTKNCPKCDSSMIALHSDDKKMCSNGACGHEVDWNLEAGQQYLYKRNVEAFVENRSNVKEAIEE